MFPQAVVDFYAANQELLWLTTLFADLACTLVLYRLFGKAGLQVAIALVRRGPQQHHAMDRLVVRGGQI